ncbi:MAG: response regulator [Candidatus Magnetomorum sp.]|nr:response regulator [Candidatus Magnetomorum sp.]
MKILIVDDSKNGALALQMRLLDRGYEETHIVYSAKDAFEFLEKQAFDDPVQLILMDICMPEMDGIEATRLLKNHETFKEIPIVMVSGDEDIERLNQAFIAGAIDFIRKSAEETELIARVASVLRLKREMERRKAREKELQALTENYKAKALEAKVASRSKSQFLANMSHEIRTPMNAITGMTCLAINANKSPAVDKYLKTVQQSAQLLLALLNDILDFSRIEAGKLTIESTEFNLRQVMEQSATIFGVKAFDNDIELILNLDNNIPVKLMGDPHRFSQILNNLLSNAIKFTHRGYVAMDAQILEQQSERIKIQFQVKDTGVGIDPSNYEKVFQIFTQEDSSTKRKYGGTGLGLTISKNLVESMDGNIEIESQPGEGSCFIFTACFGRPDSQPEKRVWFNDDCFSNLTILVVDDNITAGEAAVNTLESIGLFGVWIQNEAMLLNYLADPQNAPVDLILLDNTFSNTDGLAIAKSIRYAVAVHQPEIILMCGLGTDMPQDLIHNAGVQSVVNKPLTQRSLADAIIMAVKPECMDTRLADEKNPQFFDNDMNVLLVEDNDINIDVAIGMFKRANVHKIDIAKNGIEGFELIKKAYQTNKLYDLVFMDIQMPEMDGIEATKHVRTYESSLVSMTHQEIQRIPLIATTAHAMPGDKERFLSAGMDDYITKPIEERPLFQILEKWGKLKQKISEIDPSKETLAFTDHDNQEKERKNTSAINIKEAIARLSGNRELFFQLIERFTNEYEHVDQDIKKALDDEDFTTAHRLAHTIKGLSSNLSAPFFREAAFNLEQTIKHQKFSQIKDLFEHFQRESQRLFTEIKTIIKAKDEKTDDTETPPETENSSRLDNLSMTFPHIPEINIQVAVRRFAGNIDLFLQVLKKFYQDYQNFTDSIREAFMKKNMDKVQQQAHTLKGVASYLASDSLLDAAKNLEIFAIEKRYEKINSIISSIEGIISRIFNSIKNILQIDENLTGGSILSLPQNIHDRFFSLYILLKESDSDIKDMISDFEKSLNQFSLSFTARRHLRKMVKEINSYQFDNAKKSLKLLADQCNIQFADKEVSE